MFDLFSKVSDFYEMAKRRVGDVVHPESIQNKAKDIQEKTKKMATSLFTHKVIYLPIRENVIEAIGSTALAYAGSVVVSQVFSSAMRSVGYFSGVGAAIASGSAIHSALRLRDANSPENIRQMVQTAAITAAVTSAILLTLPYFLAETGEWAGRVGGAALGEVAGGIVGGYIAVRFAGNEEHFWNSANPLETYTIKSLQSIVASLLIDRFGTARKGLVKFVTDLMIGSLAYNAIDITRLVHTVQQKKALEGVLPRELSLPDSVSDEMLREVIGNPPTAEFLESAQKALRESKDSETFQALRKIGETFSSRLTNTIMALAEDNRLALLFDIAKSDKPLSTHQVSASLLHSMNKFSAVIDQNPELQQLNKEMDALTRQWVRLKDSPQKEVALDALHRKRALFISKLIQDKSFEKSAQLLQGLSKGALSSIGKLIVAKMRGEEDKVQTQIIDKSTELLIEQIKVEEVVEILAQVLPPILQKGCSPLAEHIGDLATDWEIAVVGFQLTGDAQKEWLKHSLSVYMPLFLLFYFVEPRSQEGSLDVKEYYQNLNQGFWSYYDGILPARLSQTMKAIISEQIQHSM